VEVLQKMAKAIKSSPITTIINPYLLSQFKDNPLLSFYNKHHYNQFVAVDIGYHGVKIITEEGLSFVPNVVCPRKEMGNTMGKDPRRISYKIDREEYFVGDLALNLSEEGDIRKNERYNLNFIKTAEFLALFRSVVYLASKGNPEPKIATGLPSSAFKSDQYYVKELRKIIEGKHEFEIAIGGKVGQTIEYEKVSFVIKDLLVYPQPIGTLASQAMVIKDGEIEELNGYLINQEDDIVRTVIDGGFYTVDVQTIVRGTDYQKFSFSLEGKGMIEPYNKIRDRIIELTKTEDYGGRIIPIWKLSRTLEKSQILIDSGVDDDLDITAEVLEVYRKYGQHIAELINASDKLNRAGDIDEIFLTGGPAYILAEVFKGIYKKNKLKVAECTLNGLSIEPRYFNVIGYFYLLLISLDEILEEIQAENNEEAV
jgi:hypothetical protein